VRLPNTVRREDHERQKHDRYVGGSRCRCFRGMPSRRVRAHEAWRRRTGCSAGRTLRRAVAFGRPPFSEQGYRISYRAELIGRFSAVPSQDQRGRIPGCGPAFYWSFFRALEPRPSRADPERGLLPPCA